MFDWWASELSAVFQPRDGTRFALDLSNQTVTLLERTRRGVRVRGEAAHGRGDFEAEVALLARIAARRGGAVDLLLPDELTLFRVETFPSEAKGHLRDEVWWRLDRLTPFAPEELAFDVAVLSVDPKTGFIEAHIAAAPWEVVEEAVTFTRAWGFDPQRVTTVSAVPGFPRGPLFHLGSSAQSASRGMRRYVRAAAAATVALALVGVGRAATERAAAADALDARRAAAVEALSAARDVRDQTLALAVEAGAAATARAERRLAAELLDSLAAALPPDASLDRVILADGALRIVGAAADPEAVLAALALAEEFDGVRYAGPLEAAEGGRAFRFALEAQVTPPPAEALE